MAAPPAPSPPSGGFHRRPLPPPSIAFSSPAGISLFTSSLKANAAYPFFPLAEAFESQSEPAFCGLATLTTILNAMLIDPGTLWKGVWRWYSPSMLDCCVDLREIEANGVTLPEFCCLARCQGLDVAVTSHGESSVDEFRAKIIDVCTDPDHHEYFVISYSRKTLNQSGDGHFSPIAAYDAASDTVLIMDVAKFKHPPHFVPVSLLFDAMAGLDKATGKPRGYVKLKLKPATTLSTCINITFGRSRLTSASSLFTTILPSLARCESQEEELFRAARAIPPAAASLVSVTGGCVNGFCVQLRESLAYKTMVRGVAANMRRLGPLPVEIEAAVVLFFLMCNSYDAAEAERALPLCHGLFRGMEGELRTEVEGAARMLKTMIGKDVGKGDYCGDHCE